MGPYVGITLRSRPTFHTEQRSEQSTRRACTRVPSAQGTRFGGRREAAARAEASEIIEPISWSAGS